MSEDTQWKPSGETLKDRAIATSRKLLEIGSNNANIVERVVFQEIGRVLAPRLEQRIQNVPEDEVRGQLAKLRSWIDDILDDREDVTVTKRPRTRSGKARNSKGKGRPAQGRNMRTAQAGTGAATRPIRKPANSAPVLTAHTQGAQPLHKSGPGLTTGLAATLTASPGPRTEADDDI